MGVYKDVYCAGKESTFELIQKVLDEVIELFPFDYIHIGGDECPKANWKECPHCQKRIKTEGLKDEHELQSYFIKRIEMYINSKGRKIIGWDEILEGGLAPNATVMSWRGNAGGIEAAKAGHNVIMTPNSHCYFDHYQSEDRDNEPLAIGGFLPVRKVYDFDPVPKNLIQANINTYWEDKPIYGRSILRLKGMLNTCFFPDWLHYLKACGPINKIKILKTSIKGCEK